MSVLQADLNVIAPELASVSPGDFAAVLSDVLLETNNLSFWGSQQMQDRVTKLLVAHTLAIAHPELAGPAAVNMQRVGEITQSYAIAAPRDPDQYDVTRWGKEYKRLRRMMGANVQVL